jgi:hypothetical protein
MRLRFAMLVLTAATLASVPAWAQNPEAVKHFQRGKELRDSEKCKEAIPEFESSLRAEESIGAFYNLGFCQEKLGNKHEAFEAYTRARDLAKRKNDERLREIGASRNALLETSPHVKLTLPNPLPAGLTIEVDGAKIPSSHYAPGETVIFTQTNGAHAVIVAAPGYEDRRLTITSEQAVPVELQRPMSVAPPPKQESGWMWQHWAGLGGAIVGTGLVVYSVASYSGYLVERNHLEDDFKQACAETKVDPCPDTPKTHDKLAAYNENEASARRQAPILIGAGVGGALLIAGGVALMILAPIGGTSKKRVGSAVVNVVPALGPHTQGLSFVGTF